VLGNLGVGRLVGSGVVVGRVGFGRLVVGRLVGGRVAVVPPICVAKKYKIVCGCNRRSEIYTHE
jgi:hypothetical protein